MQILPVRAELFRMDGGRTDRPTDGQTWPKLIVALCNFSNAH